MHARIGKDLYKQLFSHGANRAESGARENQAILISHTNSHVGRFHLKQQFLGEKKGHYADTAVGLLKTSCCSTASTSVECLSHINEVLFL